MGEGWGDGVTSPIGFPLPFIPSRQGRGVTLVCPFQCLFYGHKKFLIRRKLGYILIVIPFKEVCIYV